ncbi:hypothetical protein ACUNWD_08490 [Sunxiuqinia sp. A32]|uniref:hypothetical protein n=1 Tax=Sunxiuqinia sp. A32 TaxID=3461496 RepID=UPI0040464BFE
MPVERYLGRLCPYASDCPVYQGTLKIKGINFFIIKNVFCNRNYKGWKNCKRFELADNNREIPVTATPYKYK